MKKSKHSVRNLVVSALFTALVAVFSQILIPLPFIPINLATFAVLLTGALLPLKHAVASMVCFLLLGAIGVPVFAGFQGGLGILFGMTGGYIIGYIFCAGLVAILTKKWADTYFKIIIAMIAGTLLLYTFGTIWFMILTGTGFWSSLLACVIPFLIGDGVKIALAGYLSIRIKPRLNFYNEVKTNEHEAKDTLNS